MSEGGMIALIVIAALVVYILAACFMKNVADAKGCNGMKAFWICFFLGAFGWCYVIALPDLVARRNQERILEMLEKMDSKTN